MKVNAGEYIQQKWKFMAWPTERPLFSFVLVSVSDSMDYSIFNINTIYYNHLVDVFFRNPTFIIMSSNDKNESALLGQVVLIWSIFLPFKVVSQQEGAKLPPFMVSRGSKSDEQDTVSREVK